MSIVSRPELLGEHGTVSKIVFRPGLIPPVVDSRRGVGEPPLIRRSRCSIQKLIKVQTALNFFHSGLLRHHVTNGIYLSGPWSN